jgi:hypothetical protein
MMLIATTVISYICSKSLGNKIVREDCTII